LVKTWFSPWKGDIEDAKNISLQDRLKLWEDNVASRFIGFFIRTIFIVVALFVIGMIAVLGAFVFVVWILMPLLVVVLPIWGIFVS
jgi:hypothetical protein